MGDGFRRKVDDRIEGLASEWLDLVTEAKELKERIDVAAEQVLAAMQGAKRKVYECSDGTILTIERTAKVKGKRPKDKKGDPVEDAAKELRRSVAKLEEGGSKVTIEVGRGRGRKPKGEPN